MKKWLIGIGVLAILAAVILILSPGGRERITTVGKAVVDVVSLSRGEEHSLAGMIPARAGFFIRVRNLRGAWEKITGSDFFRGLIGSRLWQEEGIEKRLEVFRDEFKEQNGFSLDRSTVMELAGDDIALAILPAAEAGPASVVMVSRVGLKARLVEVLLRIGDRLQKAEDRVLSEEKYGDERVVLISPSEDFPFYGAYTFIDGYLAAAIAEGPARPVIEQIIDLSRQGQGSKLSESPEFTAALGELTSSSPEFLEWYFKPSRFLREGDMKAVSFSGSGAVSFLADWGEEIIRDLSAWRSVAGRLDYADGFRSQAVITREEDKAGSVLAGTGDDAVLRSFAPAGAMIFAAVASDPSRLWEQVTLAIGWFSRQGITSPLADLRNWERATGLSVKADILPVLGQRIALVSEGITGEEFLPVPPLALILPVTDRGRAAVLMERIVAWSAVAHNLHPNKEVYNGVEITVLSGLLFIQPGYALSDDCLIIGSSHDLLKKMIDVRSRSARNVGEDPDFRKVISEIPSAGSGLIYLNGEQFIESVLNLGKWYFPYQRIVPEEPILPEELYRETIVPLLRLCSICRAVGIGITGEKNLVRADCFIYIE